jgi:hypothetical protein
VRLQKTQILGGPFLSDEVVLLELSRLRKRGVITLETYMKTAKEWEI